MIKTNYTGNLLKSKYWEIRLLKTNYWRLDLNECQLLEISIKSWMSKENIIEYISHLQEILFANYKLKSLESIVKTFSISWECINWALCSLTAMLTFLLSKFFGTIRKFRLCRKLVRFLLREHSFSNTLVMIDRLLRHLSA